MKKERNILLIPFTFIALAVICIGIILWYQLSRTDELGGPVEVDTTSNVATNSLRTLVGSGEYTFVAYLDPEDPLSRKYYQAITEVLPTMDGQIAYAVKHFPLNIHPTSRETAGAIECAGNQNKFYEYYATLIAGTEAEKNLDRNDYTAVAQQVGIDTATFESCLDTESYAAIVSDDAVEAMATGAKGAPHAVLLTTNGTIIQSLTGYISAPSLQITLNEIIEAQQQAATDTANEIEENTESVE